MSPENRPRRTKLLVLAEQLAREAGKETQWGEAEGPDKIRWAIVVVKHGQLTVFVRESGKSLVVFAIIQIPDSVRESLGQVSEADRKQALIVLKSALLQNARTGFSQDPVDAQRIDQVKAMSFEQTLRVESDNSASANRFTDAIQEVATAIVQANIVFGIAIGGSKQAYSSGSPPPPDIYQ
jgi:hypothetical protein